MSDNGRVVAESLVPVNGIELCIDTFGEPSDPALLLIAGAAASMDFWDDEFCRRLAATARFVIRYDHRDTGRSTSFPAGDPPYSVVDLANDALGVLDALAVHRARLVGFGLGAALARRIAAERPHRVQSLTLMAAGADDAVPFPAEPAPDWSARRPAVRRLIAAALERGGPFTPDEPHLRRVAERTYDRTRNMAASQANHRRCRPGPPLRPRLASTTAPTLVLHGTLDPVVRAADAQALAAEIPGARLVRLEGVGHESPPPAVWRQVIDEITAQPTRGRQPA
jgi:pimeloyl-ACP methyl ester carboxylesterase